jgi:excisionase family DNA binding protein
MAGAELSDQKTTNKTSCEYLHRSARCSERLQGTAVPGRISLVAIGSSSAAARRTEFNPEKFGATVRSGQEFLPLLHSKRQAARIIGISERTLHSLIAARQLGRVRVGRRVLIPHAELVRFCENDHPTAKTGFAAMRQQPEERPKVKASAIPGRRRGRQTKLRRTR